MAELKFKYVFATSNTAKYVSSILGSAEGITHAQYVELQQECAATGISVHVFTNETRAVRERNAINKVGYTSFIMTADMENSIDEVTDGFVRFDSKAKRLLGLTR